MDELFAPPRETWQRLSPDFVRLKRRMVLVTWPILLVVAVVPLAIWAPWWVAVLVGMALAVLTFWRWQRQARWAATWGYAERDDDLYLTHGLMWRSLTIVPYGRIQAATITSGPVERSFGLATVQVITASEQSNASIPGLSAEAASALRDRLSAAAESRDMGL